MRGILIWIIIILSIIYIMNLCKPTFEIIGINPNDTLKLNKLPHSTLTMPSNLPIQIKEQKIVLPTELQPQIVKPNKCDIAIAKNRIQYNNQVDGYYKERGSGINNDSSVANNNSELAMKWYNTFKLNENNKIQSNLPIESSYLNEKKITNFNSSQIVKDFVYNNNKYNFKGIAYNEYYNQYYLLYEYNITSYSKFVEDNLVDINYKIAKYILAKEENNGLSIIYEIGPRNKINYNDIIYFSFGNFQIGPLNIMQVN